MSGTCDSSVVISRYSSFRHNITDLLLKVVLNIINHLISLNHQKLINFIFTISFLLNTYIAYMKCFIYEWHRYFYCCFFLHLEDNCLWKACLNSDGQQVHQYHQKEQLPFNVNSLIIKKTTTFDTGNPYPGLGQGQKCGRVKPHSGIPTLHLLIIGSSLAIQTMKNLHRFKCDVCLLYSNSGNKMVFKWNRVECNQTNIIKKKNVIVLEITFRRSRKFQGWAACIMG